MTKNIGAQMYSWLKDLFPICRSLTGDGNRETLEYLNKILGGKLTIHEVPTGTEAFDWTVPKEWRIREAWIKDDTGRKIVDFADNNLHVVGYSTPIDTVLGLEELQKHLYSLPEQPDAIPYVTSYYRERWGFCVTENMRQSLVEGKYHVFIDSELFDGSLTYADLLIPGETDKEIFFSTYICHASMANNELSGPVVSTALADWLINQNTTLKWANKVGGAKWRYSYRFIFIPETIGSIVYLSRHLSAMKAKTAAGFVVTCVGDDRSYSLLRSRLGNTLADKVALSVLRSEHPDFIEYSFLDRGSDERQYGAPGIDLPVVSVMRTKYGIYPEYHTSLDDLSLVTPDGLAGALDVYQKIVLALEHNHRYQVTCLGEPQLGKRGLYPTISQGGSIEKDVWTMINFIAYCDGQHDLIDIAEKINVPISELYEVAYKLTKAGLLVKVDNDTGNG